MLEKKMDENLQKIFRQYLDKWLNVFSCFKVDSLEVAGFCKSLCLGHLNYLRLTLLNY